MNTTTRGPVLRENVRGWRLPNAGGRTGLPSDRPAAELDRAVNRKAYAVTVLIVSCLLALLTNLDRLPVWWGGFAAGALALSAFGIGLLAVGVCLGGARLSDPSRLQSCPRRLPR